jgi:hypothetical protein
MKQIEETHAIFLFPGYTHQLETGIIIQLEEDSQHPQTLLRTLPWTKTPTPSPSSSTTTTATTTTSTTIQSSTATTTTTK